MIALISIALATVLAPTRPRPLAHDAVIARCNKECAGGARTPACREAILDVETALLVSLRQMDPTRIDPRILHLAAAVEDHAPLRAFALRHLPQPLDEESRRLLVNAVHSPYLAVRDAALATSTSLSAQDPLQKQLGSARWPHTSGIREESASAFLPDDVPSADALGGPLYPGASYEYLGSGPTMAWFTTTDAPDKVIAWYAKGRKAFNPEELKALLRPGLVQVNPQAMVKLMQQAGGDPQKLQALMQGQMTGAQESTDLMRLEDEQGVEQPRYIVLKESSIGAGPTPTQLVMIFRDALLEKTGIVFSLPRLVPAAPFANNPAEIQAAGKAQQIVNQIVGQPIPREDGD